MLHAKKLHGPLHFVTIIAGVWHRIATTLLSHPTSTAFRNSRPAIFTKNFLHESQLCSLRLYVFLLLSRLPILISVLYNFPPAVNWILQQLAFLSPRQGYHANRTSCRDFPNLIKHPKKNGQEKTALIGVYPIWGRI